MWNCILVDGLGIAIRWEYDKREEYGGRGMRLSVRRIDLNKKHHGAIFLFGK